MHQPELSGFFFGNMGENKNDFPYVTNETQDFIRGLIQKYQPKKIVEIGAIGNGKPGSLYSLVTTELKADNRVYTIESDGCSTHFFSDKSFSEQLDEIGNQIDFLILNPFRIFPAEILDFLIAFPYLKENAIVLLYDTLFEYEGSNNQFSSSVLYETISAKKFNRNSAVISDLKQRIENSLKMLSYPLCNSNAVRVHSASDIVLGFQLCPDTYKYIKDLFVSLTTPWGYLPNRDYLAQYETFIEMHYDGLSLHLFKKAKMCARLRLDPRAKMLQDFSCSLFSKFKYILIYGKKERGKTLLELCQDFEIEIQGFVISDGRESSKEFENIPVYPYSKIPFCVKETLILNTTGSLAVKTLLSNSKYYWIDFSTADVFP